MICGVICLRGGTFVAFCWLFCCFTLKGVGVSSGIIYNLLSDWLGGGGVMLSHSGVAALMGDDVGANVMGVVVNLGKDGPPLVVRQVDVVVPVWEPAVVVGTWRVENFRLVVLMPVFEHCCTMPMMWIGKCVRVVLIVNIMIHS